MSKENKAVTPRQATLAERVEKIEGALPRLNEISLHRTQEVAKQLGGIIQNLTELCQAMVKVSTDQLAGVGITDFDEKVDAEIQAGRTRRAQAELEKAKQVLETLVQQGTLISSDVVTETSILVGKELDGQGNSVGLGRAQVELGQFNEDIQKELLGQPVGAVFQNAEYGFEVQEIYVPNPELMQQKAAE